MRYKRIMIFGRPGSGKSTFAWELNRLTKIPLYHLDKYFFTSNWNKRDYAEFMQDQISIVNTDSWIIDGNCTKSLATRYERAEICIYFNYSKLLCVWRILKRMLHDRTHIDDRADDCPEVVRWNLITYLWTFEVRVRDMISNLQRKFPNVKFVEINNSQQLDELKKILANENEQNS
jgi:adenylate kinase family enzyme